MASTSTSDGWSETSCTLRTVIVSVCGPDDDRGVRAHACEQLAGLVQQVFEHPVRRGEEVEEVGHRAALPEREPPWRVSVSTKKR